MSRRRSRPLHPAPGTPLPSPAVGEALTDAMGMAGGLLMSVFGRSKKDGRGTLDAALVDVQVLGIADKARKALDAGLAVELLVEKVAGEGCRCPHCQADVNDVPNDPPPEPKSLVDSVRRNLQPYTPADGAAIVAAQEDLQRRMRESEKRRDRRDAWRALHCLDACRGEWSQCCPGCHGAIPEDFKL